MTRRSRRRRNLRYLQPRPPSPVRPLRRTGQPGRWRSRDLRWTFVQEPPGVPPREWFAYLDDLPEAMSVGAGCLTLQEVADWAERQYPLDDPEPAAGAGSADA